MHWLQAERDVADGGALSSAGSDPAPTVNAPDEGGVSPAEAVAASTAIEEEQGAQKTEDVPTQPAASAEPSPTVMAPEGGGASPGEAVAAERATGRRSRAKTSSSVGGGTKRR